MHRIASLLVSAVAAASALAAPEASRNAVGSTAFCLFELPAEAGNQRLLNLAAVQYMDLARDELKIVYGGGNLGGGYELKIPFKSRDDAQALIRRMQHAARECR